MLLLCTYVGIEPISYVGPIRSWERKFQACWAPAVINEGGTHYVYWAQLKYTVTVQFMFR